MSFANFGFPSSGWKRALFLVVFLLPLLYPFLLKPKDQLYSDHLGKYILGQSILQNGFRSGDLALPSRNLDPESKYCPTECIRIGEELISPFPVALGYVYALVLPFAGIEGVYVFAAILVSISFLLVTIQWKWNPILPVLLAFGSPFLVNGYFFPDVGIAAFLFIAGSFLLIRNLPGNSVSLFAFAGFLSALAGWFRIETLVFPFVFFLFLVDRVFSVPAERKGILGYAFGVFFGTILLLAIQYELYGHPFGPRFSFNQPGMFLPPWKKWEIYTGLLIANPNRIGFFGYSPLLLPVFLFGVYFIFQKAIFSGRKPSGEISVRDRFAFSGIVSFFILVLSAPNDGIIDFGSRYLHLSLPCFAGVFLVWADSFSENRKKIFLGISFVVLLFSAYVTVSYTQILSKYGRKTTKLNQVYLQEKPDLVIVQIRTYSQILGKYFFQTPTVWLMHEADIRDFFSHNSPGRFRKILFVETKAAIVQVVSEDDPFRGNKYYKSIVDVLGPDFRRSFADNREDILIFSMEKKETSTK